MAFRAILSLLLAVASAGAFAQSVSNGMALYQATCNSCHGTPPFGGPELAANNPALIKSAINGLVPAMSFLRGMYTDAQLADIAAYIASIESGPVSGPPPVPVPQFDYSDLWYNADESGWGLNLIQHASNIVFGVIYTYEAPNRPVWYVITGGSWTTSTIFTGSVYHVTGAPGNVPFNPSATSVTLVGSATLAFTDANHASFTSTVNSVQVTKSIQRQPF